MPRRSGGWSADDVGQHWRFLFRHHSPIHLHHLDTPPNFYSISESLNMPSTRSQTKQAHIDDFTGDSPDKPTAKKLEAANKAATKKTPTKKRAANEIASTESPTQKRQKTASPVAEKKAAKSPTPKKQKTASPAAEKKKDTPKTSEEEQDNKINKDGSKEHHENSEHPKDAFEELNSASASLDHHHDHPHIQINRAPVLTLWAASVTSFLHPSLPWSTCLSAGSAISSLCAISKGRAIGTINQPEDRDTSSDHPKQPRDDEEEINVMGFKLHIKDGVVVIGGDKKKGNEKALEAKFGDEEEHEARECFQKCLETWKGHEEELSKKAFGMYEKFRPDVASGQRGWGRKGDLSLEKVESVVRKA